MKKRQLIRYGAGLALAATVLPLRAQEVTFPSRPIRIVVSSAPGALTDIAARMYADRMSKVLKQPILVENMAGASSMLGARHVAKASADGYTLLASANTVLTSAALYKSPGYEVKNFVGVGEMARSPLLVITSASSPYKSIDDLIVAAKKAPGAIPYATGGVGTTSHLPIEMFAQEAKVSFNHVPYKGVSAAIPDTVSGRVAFMMSTATSVDALIKSGALRALAITSEDRSPAFPEVPTFRELGLPEAGYELFVGIFAPAAIPKGVLQKLAVAMEESKKDSELVARLKTMGQSISNIRTTEEFGVYIRKEDEKGRKLIKELQMQL